MRVIMVRASLKLASREDIFHNGKTFENKVLFIKCPLKQEFTGIYIIPELDINEYPYLATEQRQLIKQINNYNINELNNLLLFRSLYKLSENTNSLDFQFMLYLRTANDFDLFYSPNFQKPNILCYLKLNDNSITGPLRLNDIENVKEKMENGQIYIPTKKQLFQPYKLMQAS